MKGEQEGEDGHAELGGGQSRAESEGKGSDPIAWLRRVRGWDTEEGSSPPPCLEVPSPQLTFPLGVQRAGGQGKVPSLHP